MREKKIENKVKDGSLLGIICLKIANYEKHHAKKKTD